MYKRFLLKYLQHSLSHLMSESKYREYFLITATTAECQLCAPGKTVFKRKGTSSSTTVLKRHLLNDHAMVMNNPVAERNPVAKPALEMCLHHDLPLSLVDCPCFRQLERAIKETPRSSAVSRGSLLSASNWIIGPQQGRS